MRTCGRQGQHSLFEVRSAFSRFIVFHLMMSAKHIGRAQQDEKHTSEAAVCNADSTGDRNDLSGSLRIRRKVPLTAVARDATSTKLGAAGCGQAAPDAKVPEVVARHCSTAAGVLLHSPECCGREITNLGGKGSLDLT